MSAEAEAFAALDAIESGRWDRHLPRLHGALHLRQREDDYLDKIVVGTVPDGDVAETPPGIPYESRLFPGETHYTNSNTEEG
jgi:hypothetical protein